VAVVDGKPVILSTFDYIYEALGHDLTTAGEFEQAKALFARIF
jgi:hypothetical protein